MAAGRDHLDPAPFRADLLQLVDQRRQFPAQDAAGVGTDDVVDAP